MWLLFDFLSLKNDVNVPSKLNSRLTHFCNFLWLFCWIFHVLISNCQCKCGTHDGQTKTRKLLLFTVVSLPEYPLLWACSTYWRIVWAVVNLQLDSCKHINTLCGIFLLYPSLTELSSLETKWALQDVSELRYLFLDKSQSAYSSMRSRC